MDESYPRLANIYFPHLSELSDAELARLAQWDVLILAKRAQEREPGKLKRLRALNPDITLLAHFAFTYNARWGGVAINTDLLAALDENDWWMRDTEGNVVDLEGPAGFKADLLNMTTAAPESKDGDQLWAWLAAFIADRLGRGSPWDGVYLDCCWEHIAWANRGLADPIDADGDGLRDDPHALNAIWHDGLALAVARLRERVGDDYIIATNGNNTFFDSCNGSTREDFPKMHGDWYDNITNPKYGYMAMESGYRPPRFNIINGIWRGPVTPEGEPVRSAEFERAFTFALASTLVFGDGYFSFDGGANPPWHRQTWWHDLYDVDLGHPLGSAEPLKAIPGNMPSVPLGHMLKFRRFSNGLAAVNPTPCTQMVRLPGAYRLAGPRSMSHSIPGASRSMVLPQNSGVVLVGKGA